LSWLWGPDFGHFPGVDLGIGAVSCGFVVGECRNCALASAVLRPGVPVSADGQDVIRRDGRADRALLAPRRSIQGWGERTARARARSSARSIVLSGEDRWVTTSK